MATLGFTRGMLAASAVGLALSLSGCAAKVTRTDFDNEVARLRDEMQTGDRALGARIDSTGTRMDAHCSSAGAPGYGHGAQCSRSAATGAGAANAGRSAIPWPPSPAAVSTAIDATHTARPRPLPRRLTCTPDHVTRRTLTPHVTGPPILPHRTCRVQLAQ